ncbi:hypothetical protein [Lactococcus petauri]|uniref:hypothetical protein n=1 Tax=Lactococcus petauri TaxID=1940789 RepID=UPI0018AB2BA9|nr:hypothetical protein [Lactococcus petauri]MDC0826607.1 hypothetical protein [Lactococcus petauri]
MKQKIQQNKRAIAFFFSLTLLSLVALYFNHKFVLGLQIQVMLWLSMLVTKYLEKRDVTIIICEVRYKLSLKRGLGIIILVDLLLIISGVFAMFQ